MASAGAPQGPRSRSAAPRRQQTLCRGSPASLPGPTRKRTYRTRGSSPTWPHMIVKNVEFSLKSSLQLHKCNQDSSQCERCPGESQPCSTGPSCTTSDPGCQQGEAPHRQHRILDRSPYACALCGRGFSQKQALLHHQQAGCSKSLSDIVNAAGLPDDCPPVSEEDSTRSDSTDTPGPGCSVGMCQFCSTTFPTEPGLQRHNRTDHAEQGLKTMGGCSDRDEQKGGNTKVKGDLIKMHKSKTKLLDCRSCDMVFRSTAKLYMHRKEKHSREKNIVEPRPVIIKRRRVGTYPCQICSKVFLHHLSLRAHYRQHTASSFSIIKNKSQSSVQTKDSELSENASNNVNPSIAVDKPVKAGPGRPRKVSKVENKVAVRGRHKEVPEEEEEEEDEEEEEEEEEREREFPCPSCAEVFSMQSRLQEHVELHQSSVKRRQCSVCATEMDTCKWPGSKRQRLYHCVPCQQGFSALGSFLEHCQEHLRVRVEQDSITERYTH
ncbi:uncharacterized protein AB9W97_017712 isoform 2-T4 [Spinachia spinachia]